MANHADQGASDLGKRIAEQRSRLGLSLADAAERAGMSPGYLAYLESSPNPNPTQATLIRLTAALDAAPGVLSGASLNVPPGQRGAAKNAVLHELTRQQCLDYIAPGGIGRFLFDDAARGPVALPVNFRMDGADVIFRTGRQDSVAEAMGRKVSFDVDSIDDALGEGWSVLLSGSASVISDPAGLARVQDLDIEPWAGGDRNLYVRFVAAHITGRQIRVTG